MNFLWDMVLRAQAQGWEKEALFFLQARSYSPYYEQSFSTINQREVERAAIELNALYRFSHIFQELLHPDLLTALEEVGAEEFAPYLFDFVMHFLSEINLRHGLNRREYFVRKLRAELLHGIYGPRAADAFAGMEKELQFSVANELLTQFQTGSNLLSFRRAVTAIFKNCIIYQSNFNCKELLLYIEEKETTVKAQRMQFLLDTFLPFGFSIRCFWEHHFGIIGVDATMRSDAIAIF